MFFNDPFELTTEDTMVPTTMSFIVTTKQVPEHMYRVQRWEEIEAEQLQAFKLIKAELRTTIKTVMDTKANNMKHVKTLMKKCLKKNYPAHFQRGKEIEGKLEELYKGFERVPTITGFHKAVKFMKEPMQASMEYAIWFSKNFQKREGGQDLRDDVKKMTQAFEFMEKKRVEVIKVLEKGADRELEVIEFVRDDE